MKLSWSKLAHALGAREGDQAIADIVSAMAEVPVIEKGPLGDRTYYSFIKGGILLLFEEEYLTQVSAFLEAHDGFSPFADQLPDGIVSSWQEGDLLRIFGP